jgi:multidrug efflux system membrane fusion protein
MQDHTASQQPSATYAAPSSAAAQRRRRNPLIITGVLALIIAGVGGAVWLAHRPATPAGGPGGAAAGRGGAGGRGGGGRRPATTVGVATASQADIPITIDGLGTVTPAATVTVTPQVSGVITQVLYKEGQTVQKGQTLAIIDPRPLQMALNQAQGQLARDQAQLTNAKLQLDRDKTLLTQDSIARQDVDTQTALVGQLQGTITADQAAVGTAQLNLGFSRVIAPVSGKVGLRPVDLGNFINAGATGGVAVITQVTPIDVQFTIPQVDLPRVQANAARCDLVVTALDQSKTITLDQGVFSTLDNRIDTTTGTVKAKARFGNAKGNLFPNQFVNVKLDLETLHNVVVVPVTAVRTGPQGDFVWVLQPDKTVTLRTVTRGPATVDSTSITKGLDSGEQVITEGGDRLTEGARVQLPGDRPIPAGGRRGGRGRRGGAGAPGVAGAAAGGAGQAAGAAAGSGAADQTPGQGGGRRGRRGGQDQTASAQDGQAQGPAAAGGSGRRGGRGGQGAAGQDGQAQGPLAAGGAGRRGGRGGRGGMAAGGRRGQASGCYSAPTPRGGGQPGQGRGGRGGRGGQGGDNAAHDAQPTQQGRGQGRGGQNRQRGGDNQDVTTPTAPNGQPRRQRPGNANGQGAGAGQGGGQSNGG